MDVARSVPETMPTDTEVSWPLGWPTVMTQEPACSASESPKEMGVSVSSPASILSRAMSLVGSVPTMVAS